MSGTNGNRTNIGIANPVAGEHTIALTLFDAAGTERGEKFLDLEGGATVQINDVFAYFGVEPLDGAMVHVGSSRRVYSYASIVHGSSGDPTFVIGNESSMALPMPQCASPARVTVDTRWSDVWIVLMKDGSTALSTIDELKAKYGVEPTYIYTSIGGFASVLDPRVVTQLQCEPAVAVIEQNTSGGPAAARRRTAGDRR